MVRLTAALCLVVWLALPCSAAMTGEDYMLTEHWGGAWSDAEKSPLTDDDNGLCWAAGAANVLDWTGWGHVGGMSDTDAIFAHFQYHWFAGGASPNNAWQWWFDADQAWAPFVIQVPDGGGFYPELNIDDYYHSTGGTTQSMSAIDQYLHAGYGTVATLYSTAEGISPHVVTVWGITTATGGGDYQGIWITDSDDSKSETDPADLLLYYTVNHTGSQWHLQDYYGVDTYYLGPVHALAPIPEPTTLALMALGMMGIRRRRT